MAFFYSAFGLTLGANRAVPGLAAGAAASPPDVTLWLNPDRWPVHVDAQPGPRRYVSAETGDDNAPALQVWSMADGAWFKLRYDDGTEFLVDRSGAEVWARWHAASTVEDMGTYLLGPVLGFVLRLRGITCLHASAVAVDGRAIALLGPPCAGKSTTAAAFALNGYPVLADDIVALAEGDEMAVQPAHPRLRLWPDSVALLFGTPDALPRLTPGWDKRVLYLGEPHTRFQARPLPLAAIYVLAGGATGSVACAGVRAREGLLALVANSYVNYLLDARMRGDEFRCLARVASTVPVRLVPPDAGGPSERCHRILKDYESLRCTASVNMDG
jgi:hypothetical protein